MKFEKDYVKAFAYLFTVAVKKESMNKTSRTIYSRQYPLIYEMRPIQVLLGGTESYGPPTDSLL